MDTNLSLPHKNKILETLFDTMPYLFWKGIDGKYQGVNTNYLDNSGLFSPQKFVGKTIYEILKNNPGLAKEIDDNDNNVMNNKQTLVIEESFITPDGEEKKYISQKSPMYNKDGEVEGLLGFCMDITAIKAAQKASEEENQRLVLEKYQKQLEIENYKKLNKQQEQFKTIVDQAVHDIGSPLMVLNFLVPECAVLPEDQRNMLHLALNRIYDITRNLLNRADVFKQEAVADSNKINSIKNSSILAGLNIIEIIAEKRYEYNQLPVKFVTSINSNSHFAFINGNTQTFKRMLSNLINNAVDALEGKPGIITIHLDVTTDNEVQIIIEDNGKGMPEIVKGKILNNVAITSGKDDGHGIGFGQIRDTLTSTNGKLAIESEAGKGTKVILTFPMSEVPDWICSQIVLNPETTIIILDDEPSIHTAWEIRFNKDAPNIKRKHFEEGSEAIQFIKELSDQEKEHLFLLTDYELLNQEFHGLDVVSQTNIKRSALVTSHHNSQDVRKLAKQTNTKILPKPLAAEVNIIIADHITVTAAPLDDFNDTNLIIVDDNNHLVESIIKYAVNGEKVKAYYNPQDFLDKVTQYTKDTHMLITDDFKNFAISGFEILEQLHKVGFSKLYLYSNATFTNDKLPNYIHQVIGKADVDTIEKLAITK